MRAALVDDMALCRAVKENGGRVVFADGHRMADCRMYSDGAALWRGFAKNFYEGIGGHPLALLAVLGLDELVQVFDTRDQALAAR